jgi:hypothetical protein
MKYGAERISNNTIIREGLPYGGFYLLENTGIFRSKERGGSLSGAADSAHRVI